MPTENPSPDSLTKRSETTSCWQQVWRQHSGWLRTVIAARMDGVWVDEVLQNVAIIAWERQSQLSSSEKLAPWLYRIAVQQVGLFFRETNRRRRMTVAIDVAETDSVDATQTDPLELLTQQEVHAQVRLAMQQLPAEQREVLMLKHTEGWTYQQLADRLGLKRDQVIYRVGQAKQNLRNQLDSLSRNRNEKLK